MDRFKILAHTKDEGYILIPNEIFEDLRNNISKPLHRSFAYSYYYLITYLYRYTKYTLSTKMTQPMLKEILGQSPIYKPVDYIIKKDGILDNLGYTQTTTNIPIYHEFSQSEGLKFHLLDEYKKDHKEEMSLLKMYDNGFRVKFPVKAFFRDEEAMNDDYYNGTFFEAENTHSIPIETFLFAMNNKNIGTDGFYLYAILKQQIDFRGKWVAMSREEIKDRIGFSHEKIGKLLVELISCGLLFTVKQNYLNNPEHHANIYSLKKIKKF